MRYCHAYDPLLKTGGLCPFSNNVMLWRSSQSRYPLFCPFYVYNFDYHICPALTFIKSSSVQDLILPNRGGVSFKFSGLVII